MTETLVQSIIDALGGSVGKEAIVFIISMIPILELRGALLVAGPLLGVPVAKAIPLCIIGNIIPVPFILLLITPIFKWMKGTKLFKSCAVRGDSPSGNRGVDRVADCGVIGREV